jgi:hypothetical protein
MDCSRWPSYQWPNPGCAPEPAGPGNAGGRRRPLGLDPPATPPSRRPGPAGALAVTGPLMVRRQRPRRRITPNTTTSTTTMISTHNHVDMAASLVGAGAVPADATAAYPSKQLGHRQATSQSQDPRALGSAPGGTDGLSRPTSPIANGSTAIGRSTYSCGTGRLRPHGPCRSTVAPPRRLLVRAYNCEAYASSRPRGTRFSTAHIVGELQSRCSSSGATSPASPCLTCGFFSTYFSRLSTTLE